MTLVAVTNEFVTVVFDPRILITSDALILIPEDVEFCPSQYG
jgi:hypothetical protein